MSEIVLIRPNDPLLFRDARPFGSGGSDARTLPFPHPSATAGSLRTLLGRQAGMRFDSNDVETVKGWKIHGPLLHRNGQVYFPAPADAYLAMPSDSIDVKRLLALRPLSVDGETNGPDKLLPVGLHSLEGKPGPIPKFWPQPLMETWLAGNISNPADLAKEMEETGFSPEIDRRTHVKIDDALTAEDHLLFSTEGLSLTDKRGETGSFLVRVEGAPSLDTSHGRIGGEARVAEFSIDASAWPNDMCINLKTRLETCKKVKLQLATPALFAHGWLPEWIDKKAMTGEFGDVKLKLAGACVPRWKPLSGWDLHKAKTENGNGHKALRRMVPAGSAYFFEILSDHTAWNLAENLWLAPVSDDDQDKNDGFGLALWGCWA